MAWTYRGSGNREHVHRQTDTHTHTHTLTGAAGAENTRAILAAKEPTIANSTCSNTRAHARDEVPVTSYACCVTSYACFVTSYACCVTSYACCVRGYACCVRCQLLSPSRAGRSSALRPAGCPCTYLVTRIREGGREGGRGGERERGSERKVERE